MRKGALLAYCGLYCADCAGHSGEIADSARNLVEALERYKFHRTATCLFARDISDYDGFHDTLAFMTGLRCPAVCTERAADEAGCEIRACCIGRRYYACHECPDFEGCEKLSGLEALHGDACVRNLRAIREMGLEEWIVSGERLWFGSEADDP